MLERIHLSIVQQVEKQGSLTAAAGVLNLTQSALSHSMKKLEQQLGTDVWLREGRSLRLTQAGQYLLAVANRLAVDNGSPDGFRVIINTGRIGQQEVPHLHAHLVGGPDPVGPMLKRL